ncbi:Lem3/Cdc50 [Microthyrium microscopicum]|uniref:Lem3/Cdc50 n=1 Tax=Microthyrium microscopicum TaxID=703497 RepID=A0A6A6UJS1_9PEZI|nr:Lem3/Cdc50 [Microthyrium microscopicum]
MSQTQATVQHADSINSNDNAPDEKKKQKSKRPPNTAFRQQRLKAWQPILTPKTVLPLFFAVGVIFAPIGGLLLWASSQVQEISIDYSNCAKIAPSDFENMSSDRLSASFKSSKTVPPARWKRETNTSVTYNDSQVQVNDTTKCILQFSIPEDMKPPVLLYYRLTNFYQNHRRYVKSFDSSQLDGNARTADQIHTSDCDPLAWDANKKPYYPCGLIANSIFNDTYVNLQLLNPSGSNSNSSTNSSASIYNMTASGIAWSSDKSLYKNTEYKAEDVVPPPNWVRRWDYSKKLPDLSTDEAFQVWMRTAGLPTFSKLALRNDKDVMQTGSYQIEIWDEFNTTLYGGTKAILISTRTVMGGKNPFLGIAYIVVGGLCILLGALFTATHIIKPRKLGDHTYLSWDKEPTAAQATRPQN